ncbi:TetR/AcrR family transcriptional regulator [Microbulbifer rhizosphaerae]|uniref:AcrR family transcriptional regulator n=1 Tax=Microbulbifer rhizosphaerae TaxID=1562603 RepID=A0A7W4WE12_9GAMM|nr:TetR/AcrR family transcriptional regulator [Microbulbifer rhizosphaerae]MBB3061943.1 AcrR family transcriptional regulator [Microbulbifer rhizosphaerae]
MATSERKARELRQREEMLLDTALEMLEKDGFATMTMDKLARRSEYSKGTIYNHFASKEDLLTALCLRGFDIQLQLYRSTRDFEGTSREKMLALYYGYYLYARQHPTLFMCVLSGQSPNVIEKTSPERIAMRRQKEREVAAICDRVVAEALVNGDIPADRERIVGELTFANWAIAFGTTALLLAAEQAYSIARLDQTSSLLTNAGLVMDGIGWHPLSDSWDYRQSWSRIQSFFGA